MTLGDPAGIGPEVTRAALATAVTCEPLSSTSRFVIFGPDNLTRPMAVELGPAVTAIGQASFSGSVGQPSAESGRAALAALDAAIEQAQRGEVDALVTAPISKEALALAGSTARGHTEILEERLGRGRAAMAFFAERLRVVLVTQHVPLRDVPKLLSEERVVDTARLFRDALVELLGIAEPRLALCGCNPHAGEAGLLGDEEEQVLAPAAARARDGGIDLTGPYASDSLFQRALAGAFDGVVALYHDQGLIPIKMLGTGAATHVTLGLSVPRTSPEHGTAFDIAGRGTARPDGMLAAIRLAARFARTRAGGTEKT